MKGKKRPVQCINCFEMTTDPKTVETFPFSFLSPLCPKCAEYALKVKKCRETSGRCTCGVHISQTMR